MTDDLRTRIARWLYRRFLNTDWEYDDLWEHEKEEVRMVWLDAADALIRELPELHQPMSMSDYAVHLCQSGCDCSCCYGMDDCYHVTDPCNCGMAAKDHAHD